MENKEYVLRGFIRLRPSGRFVGVCLRPNLVVEADSREEALEKLKDLIGAYRADAVRDGELDHFMKQRAPLAFYLEWFSLRIAQFGHENWRNIRDVVRRLLHEQPNSSGPVPDAVGRPFRTFTESRNASRSMLDALLFFRLRDRRDERDWPAASSGPAGVEIGDHHR